MRIRGLFGLVLGLFMIGIAQGSGPVYRFSPAGNFPGAYYSIPLGLNLTQVVGYYHAAIGIRGYIQTGSSFVSVDELDSVASHVSGINRFGAAVGGYCPTGCNPWAGVHGFLYKNGKITNIDYPSANTSTTANGINDLGQIVGGYCPNNTECPTGLSPANFGFLDDKGAFTTLAYPGALVSQANAINNAGQVVGTYYINDTGPHSYLYATGVYTNIDYPGSLYTVGSAINNAGVVAGLFEDQLGVHGFTYADGIFTEIDLTGLVSPGVTAINDHGVIVGTDYNSRGGLTNFKGVPLASDSKQ